MKNETRYLIVASGTLHDKGKLTRLIERADVVVCVDGGARHLFRIGSIPDLLIGDLDSIDATHREYYDAHHVKLIRHPREKDATDTELAVEWAIENGATEITLTGVTGVRLDHTLANILLLKSIWERGVKAWIVDDYNEIFLLSHMPYDHSQAIEKGRGGGCMTIHGEPGQILSVVPLSSTVKGITLEGLVYPLQNANLSLGASHGISNLFKENTAHISIREGTVLITKSRDAVI